VLHNLFVRCFTLDRASSCDALKRSRNWQLPQTDTSGCVLRTADWYREVVCFKRNTGIMLSQLA
jgi:hypothetical protein